MNRKRLKINESQFALLKSIYSKSINQRRKEIFNFRKNNPLKTFNNRVVNMPVFKTHGNSVGDLKELEDEVFNDVVKRPENSTALYYKYFFNYFFNTDLYGKYDSEENIILSTGSLDHDEMRLPGSLKYAVDFAMMNNWYGYSSSLGRNSARHAIADLENNKTNDENLKFDNIVLIKGVMDGFFHLISFLKEQTDEKEFCVLTYLPTYIPLATACEKIAKVEFVNNINKPVVDVKTIIENIKDHTKIVVLSSDFNPTGKALSTIDINYLADYCLKKRIYLIIDEAGAKYPDIDRIGLKANPYLIRMESLSKKMSIPGMKLGYFIADKKLVDKFYERASTCYGSPASFFYLLQELDARFNLFQLKGLVCLTKNELDLFDINYRLSLSWLQFLYNDYLLNRRFFLEKIQLQRSYTIDLLNSYKPSLISEIIMPETGVNIFIKLNSDLNNYIFFRKLLIAKSVAVFPGICLGVKDGCWIRLTISTKWDELKKGLNEFITFLKEEYIIQLCKDDPFYNKILLEFGYYNKYKELNFFAHLFDVNEKIYFLKDNLRKIYQYEYNDSTLRDLAICHDAGKVLSTLTQRIFRILRLQTRYRKVPNRILKKWRDQDLLFLKDDLSNGNKVGLDDLLNKYDILLKFKPAIDWQSKIPPKDIFFTILILIDLKTNATLFEKKRIDQILEVIKIDEVKINFINDGLLKSSFILLDIADKLADYEIKKDVTIDILCNMLKLKRKYVIGRYCNKDGFSCKDTYIEYKESADIVRNYFNFKQKT